MKKAYAALVAAIALVGSQDPAGAVFSGDMSERARSGDADYADGQDAFKVENWQGVIEAMNKVVARRPWHDNAHTYLGYAHRKLQNYEQALIHYGKALDHHPRNRRALSYLGEAHLEMCEPEKAEEVLERLAKICQNVVVSFSDGAFNNGCEEYESLKASYEFYMEHGWVEMEGKTW